MEQLKSVTLAEINAELAIPQRDTNGYRIAFRNAVGRTGSSRRGHSGSHLHIVRVETIIAEHGEHRAGTLSVGDVWSITGACNGNGQRTAIEVKGADTDAVTCAKCLKRLENMTAWVRARQAERAELERARVATAIDAPAPFYVEIPKYSHESSAATRTVLSTDNLEEARERADRERECARFAVVRDARQRMIYVAHDASSEYGAGIYRLRVAAREQRIRRDRAHSEEGRANAESQLGKVESALTVARDLAVLADRALGVL